MEHYVPYARSDVGSSQVESVVEWLGVHELLARMRQLPPESEFPMTAWTESSGPMPSANISMMNLR
jgi:hypothetical protein